MKTIFNTKDANVKFCAEWKSSSLYRETRGTERGQARKEPENKSARLGFAYLPTDCS